MSHKEIKRTLSFLSTHFIIPVPPSLFPSVFFSFVPFSIEFTIKICLCRTGFFVEIFMAELTTIK